MLLECLNDHAVEFVIIGGLCLVLHGCPMMTQDIDICIRLTPENLFRLERALHGLNPVHRMTPDRIPFILNATLAETLKSIYLRTDLGILDCLGTVAGLGDYTAVLSQSIHCLNSEFRMLSAAALIVAKEAAGRPRDLEAVKWLRAAAEHGQL